MAGTEVCYAVVELQSRGRGQVELKAAPPPLSELEFDTWSEVTFHSH
jgi:hypothetical protein